MKLKLKFQRKAIASVLSAFACIALVSCSGPSSDNWSAIEEGFKNPPNEARPRVWWHWMNGNISQDGIQKDLEWMSRIGIGGFQNFDAALSTPQIVDERLVYMTPEWKAAFKFATEKAVDLGFEMAIAGSPGWSESGGPWVKPEQGMKKYVWSETVVEGGQAFSGQLLQPPQVTGPFQNIPMAGGMTSLNGAPSQESPVYYSDVAVVAYRIPDNDVTLSSLAPKVTSSGGQFTLQSLTDGNLANPILLPSAPVGQKAWIQFEFDEPLTIQGLTISTGSSGRRRGSAGGSSNMTIEVSDDGRAFNVVTEIASGGASQNTYSFPAVTSRYFRFCVLTPEPQTAATSGMFGMAQSAPTGTQISELVLQTGARVHRFEDKAGFSVTSGINELPTPSISGDLTINKDNVIDLTSEMTADGTLNWASPEGKWVIMRLGYSLIGTQNHPASPEATGLEVDKLNKQHVRAYFEEYINQYRDATGGLIGETGLQYIITDSYEAGAANWTDNMIEEFNNRNNYSMIPWLPVLAGYVVESAESSDKFLWDFFITLEELIAEYHYDELTTLLAEYNMKRYTESHENGRALIADGMEVKRSAAVPMSATWMPRDAAGDPVRHQADIRESASVAHIYGQNLVAAESLTASGQDWSYHPERLKPTADIMLSSGLNRFVIHCSPHQPVDDKIPGLSLGQFGQWFTRHETWSEQAEAWISYLARCSYMLQQGKALSDVIYIYGESSNITALFGNALPDVPAGYEYDFLNAGAIANVLSVNKGKIVTPSGMSYSLLALDESTKYMTLPVLKKIEELVNAGAVIVGAKPVKTPSLNDDASEFAALADKLWGSGNGVQSAGKGKIYAGQAIGEVLGAIGVEPDFEYTKPQSDTELRYVHRALNNSDIYWVNNRKDRYEDLAATFRVEGKAAEIWNPETGEIKEASYSIENGKTTVQLNLKPNDAVFVVFREKASSKNYQVPPVVEEQVGTIEGAWTLSFQPNRGAPESITLSGLMPWNEHSDAGIKYFSGTGTYTNTFTVPAEWISSGKEIWIDLGSVKNIAEVYLNGTSVGTVWKTPFKVNLTSALKEGNNNLEVKVTNLWVNRIIGDAQPGVRNPYTFQTQNFWKADSPLLPSGLLGPVKIMSLTN